MTDHDTKQDHPGPEWVESEEDAAFYCPAMTVLQTVRYRPPEVEFTSRDDLHQRGYPWRTLAAAAQLRALIEGEPEGVGK